MKSYKEDKRVVMTLDAGGTNFVFSAYRGCEEVVEPITMPSNGSDLNLCLQGMISGFEAIKAALSEEPSAISFAFPGPADYPAGIIGDLANLPSFRGGVALKDMLEDKFSLPVFVNNDGNLYALGEAMYGYLPYINEKLKSAGSIKQFSNITGFTLGTGFGGGIVSKGRLLLGDNSDSAELWSMSNRTNPELNIEELISIRAVTRNYKTLTSQPDSAITPKDIFLIAKGEMEGDKTAALESYNMLGRALGDALANVLTITDGLAVIGGGVSAAAEFFAPAMVAELAGKYSNGNPHIATKVFYLEDEESMKEFATDVVSEIKVPFSDRTITYQSHKRLGIGLSKIGTAEAISIGAYIFAIDKLDCGAV